MTHVPGHDGHSDHSQDELIENDPPRMDDTASTQGDNTTSQVEADQYQDNMHQRNNPNAGSQGRDNHGYTDVKK